MKIADVLPDAYILENGEESMELVLQGHVDPTTVNPIARVINEESVDEYQRVKRRQLIEEIREVQSYKTSVPKRVLCAIVNQALRSIND